MQRFTPSVALMIATQVRSRCTATLELSNLRRHWTPSLRSRAQHRARNEHLPAGGWQLTLSMPRNYTLFA